VWRQAADGWEGRTEPEDLSMARRCSCERTVGGARFSTRAARHEWHGGSLPGPPVGWMAAGFGEKQHAGHPGLGRRRGHGANLTDNLARRGAVQPHVNVRRDGCFVLVPSPNRTTSSF
jgi:hypothetical protein